MEIDSQKQDKLSEQLATLPLKAAIALLREVQRDELRGGNNYPHTFVTKKLIENLVLQGVEPELLGQTWNLFCEPFEAFLVFHKTSHKNPGAIQHTSITVIWNWLLSELFQDRLPDLEIEIIQAMKDDNSDHARTLMAEFHKEAGSRIWSELSTVEEGSRAHIGFNSKFGTPGVFEDALEMAKVLQIAPALLQLRNKVRKGLTLNQDEDVIHCCGLYKQFLRSAEEHVEYGMMMIARRLEKPYEVLKVVAQHTGAETDVIILQDPASQSGSMVLCDLEDSINEAIKLIAQYEDFPTVATKIKEFYTCVELFTSLVEISPRSLWGSKIIQIRNDLSSIIKQEIEQLPRLINVLRYKNKTSLTSSTMIDEEKGPNAYDVSQALYIANLLAVSGRSLKQLSINDAFAKAKTEADNFIEAVAEIIVSALAKGDQSEKERALKYFQPILELTKILQGKEIASLLERRGDSAFRSQSMAKPETS